jgi:hypothetical protein
MFKDRRTGIQSLRPGRIGAVTENRESYLDEFSRIPVTASEDHPRQPAGFGFQDSQVSDAALIQPQIIVDDENASWFRCPHSLEENIDAAVMAYR